MAQKNTPSRAEKAVSDAKKKTAAPQSNGKSSAKKPAANAKKGISPKKAPAVKTEYERSVPSGVWVSVISIALFILFVVISIKPEGALLKLIQSLVLGLIGQAGFYFSIPMLLYLFVINTFSRKTAVTMRSICVILFVFSCSCIHHLAVQTQGMASGFALLADLYAGGVEGITGGVLCGGAAMLVRWACGTPISYLLFGITAVLTLLGAMQITIPSIVRAIANRPREDW